MVLYEDYSNLWCLDYIKLHDLTVSDTAEELSRVVVLDRRLKGEHKYKIVYVYRNTCTHKWSTLTLLTW